MNCPTQFNHHLSFSSQIVDGFSEGYHAAQTQPPTGLWNIHQEPIKLADHEIATVPDQIEDLNAVVRKCNVNGFQNMFYMRDRRIIAGEEEEEKSLKRKRKLYVSSPSFRENHIVSERLRRNEMKELFARMRSLLPENPTAKSDRASIVTETIKYIQSLKRGLGLSLAPKAHQTACDKSMYSKYSEWNDNLTVKYNGKDIFIAINSLNTANLLPSIILAVESHDMQVMDVSVSVTERLTFVSLRLK
ncbi:hypothetical protein KI387_014137, partial [Taxus chinensis]